MQLSLEHPPKETVVKSNKLVKAKTPFTKLEHRVVAALIAQLRKGQEAFSTQRVSLNEITDLAGISSTEIYRRAEDLCDSLAQKSVGVQEEEDGGRVYRAIPIFSECAYVEDRGVIEAQFNSNMGQYLLQLTGRYTMYALPFFLQLRSRYAMRIYELLKMREGLKELKISVGELREILSLEDKYAPFSQLKHHVLEKARGSVRERTDIWFTYEVEREGQTPVRVVFYIKTQAGRQLEESPDPVRDRSFDYDEQTEERGVRLDPKTMFKSELEPEELSRLSGEELEELYSRARSEVEEGAGEAWTASETLRRMRKIWD